MAFSALPWSVISNYSDSFWGARNHHPHGQAQILFFIQQHYPLPALSDTRAWLWLSQVSQGYCIRQQAEHYRRLMSDCAPRGTGGGCNRGALFWQGADAWPAPTWSSLEYGGRRKLLHYYAARFFAPLLVSAFLEGDMRGGGVAVVNEDPGAARAGSVRVRLVSLEHGLVGALPDMPFSLPPAASARVGGFTLAQIEAASGGACPAAAPFAGSRCFLVYEALGLAPPAPPLPPRALPAGPDFLLLGSPGGLQDPALRVLGVQALEPYKFAVQWTGAAPALFCWFETPLRGAWGDNGFAFVPGLLGAAPPPLIWTAAPDGAPPSASELQAGLRVWSLYDVAAGIHLT